jgi:hypothetical protein
MGEIEDLDDAVRAAQVATVDFCEVLTAHDLIPGTLNFLHADGVWPAAVTEAYVSWENRIEAIARILGEQHDTGRDIPPDSTGSVALLIRAYVLGLGLDE